MLLLSLSCLLPPLLDRRRYGSRRIASQSQRSHQRVILSNVTKSFCSIEFPIHAEYADILQNKVLLAAAISGAIGQLSKPFTSSIRHGISLDFRKALQAGGFPSTHSSAAVAAATTIGFERGFSDSIYGLAVVYACLTMYDAQGVRREVGTHAKCLNKVLTEEKLNQPIVSISNPASDYLGSIESSQKPNETVLVDSADSTTDVQMEFSLLKESIGHTETEVIAGALLGFLVSLALCAI